MKALLLSLLMASGPQSDAPMLMLPRMLLMCADDGQAGLVEVSLTCSELLTLQQPSDAETFPVKRKENRLSPSRTWRSS